MILRYFSAYNSIDNQNRIHQSDIALEKYWVTQSGYFRLATTVLMGMGIAVGKILLCHGISDKIKDKYISIRQYNNKKVYECFNNTFSIYCGIPTLNLPSITIDDTPHKNKRAMYTSDTLPASISVPYGNYVSALTKHNYYPKLL